MHTRVSQKHLLIEDVDLQHVNFQHLCRKSVFLPPRPSRMFIRFNFEKKKTIIWSVRILRTKSSRPAQSHERIIIYQKIVIRKTLIFSLNFSHAHASLAKISADWRRRPTTCQLPTPVSQIRFSTSSTEQNVYSIQFWEKKNNHMKCSNPPN